ncbi:hypothetical protein KIN20_022441 [Parelaphostrongylus tenuis]|uniref:Uncharacterized protein n=1 Tax=Parelaphostrongylus tenuis TaxID=148309 RepID=A0AAD5MU52_PARTN|nr:hypothetical protein KIN20_022441 [Parelaphostrongylus tenuis]
MWCDHGVAYDKGKPSHYRAWTSRHTRWSAFEGHFMASSERLQGAVATFQDEVVEFRDRKSFYLLSPQPVTNEAYRIVSGAHDYSGGPSPMGSI